jgi:hypothetical protein
VSTRPIYTVMMMMMIPWVDLRSANEETRDKAADVVELKRKLTNSEKDVGDKVRLMDDLKKQVLSMILSYHHTHRSGSIHGHIISSITSRPCCSRVPDSF